MVFNTGSLRKTFEPNREDVTGGCKNCVLRAVIICIPHKILFGTKLKEHDMGGAHVTRGGEEKYIHDFDGGTRKKETTCRPWHRGKLILKLTLKKQKEGGY